MLQMGFCAVPSALVEPQSRGSNSIFRDRLHRICLAYWPIYVPGISITSCVCIVSKAALIIIFTLKTVQMTMCNVKGFANSEDKTVNYDPALQCFRVL